MTNLVAKVIGTCGLVLASVVVYPTSVYSFGMTGSTTYSDRVDEDYAKKTYNDLTPEQKEAIREKAEDKVFDACPPGTKQAIDAAKFAGEQQRKNNNGAGTATTGSVKKK